MVTDYDCWREGEGAPSITDILTTFKNNAHKAIELIKTVIPKVAEQDWTHDIKELKERVNGNIM